VNSRPQSLASLDLAQHRVVLGHYAARRPASSGHPGATLDSGYRRPFPAMVGPIPGLCRAVVNWRAG
jgi:hypothetical protein